MFLILIRALRPENNTQSLLHRDEHKHEIYNRHVCRNLNLGYLSNSFISEVSVPYNTEFFSHLLALLYGRWLAYYIHEALWNPPSASCPILVPVL